MGLLSILKKVKQKEKEVRLLILGLDNAGKTTIVKKFNGDDINAIEPTLGFNIKTLEYKGYKLNVWDVGGQQTIRSYWRNYFEQTDGLIWVVDSADRGRLQDCKRELHDLLGQEVRSCKHLCALLRITLKEDPVFWTHMMSCNKGGCAYCLCRDGCVPGRNPVRRENVSNATTGTAAGKHYIRAALLPHSRADILSTGHGHA
ncbi:unnamed protein product [Pylaiella littoralis]